MGDLSERDYGRECGDDDPFKARARRHQSRFRVDDLGLSSYRDYGCRLTTDDALAGKNFYPRLGIVDAVEQRFGRGDKKLWWDMLGSDHIPFNFFVPLRHEPWTVDLVRAFGKGANRLHEHLITLPLSGRT